MITVQAVFDFSFDPSRVGTFASWVVALTGQCINERSQRRHRGGRRDGERHRFPPCFIEEGVRINTECYIRMVLATSHGALWHRHVELVVAGRQRPITHQPAHQSVF